MLAPKLQQNIFFKQCKSAFYHNCKIKALFFVCALGLALVKDEKGFMMKLAPIAAKILLLPLSKRLQRKAGDKCWVQHICSCFKTVSSWQWGSKSNQLFNKSTITLLPVHIPYILVRKYLFRPAKPAHRWRSCGTICLPYRRNAYILREAL